MHRIAQRPPRCMLANVATAEAIGCLFNPTQFSERLQVNWNRLTVPGLSHQVLQFQSTANRQIAGVEFYLDKLFASELPGDPDILGFRRFLLELTRPQSPSDTVLGGAPPRVLFLWPGVISVEAVLTELEFHYRQFGADGGVLVYTATCTFEEISDVRRASSSLPLAEVS